MIRRRIHMKEEDTPKLLHSLVLQLSYPLGIHGRESQSVILAGIATARFPKGINDPGLPGDDVCTVPV